MKKLFVLELCYEGLLGSILHCNPLAYVDFVVNELLAHEMCLKSQDYKKMSRPSGVSILQFHIELPPENIKKLLIMFLMIDVLTTNTTTNTNRGQWKF